MPPAWIDESLVQLLLAVSVLVVAVVWLRRRGCLSARAFAGAPLRNVELGPGDLCWGMLLWFGGGMLAMSATLKAMGLSSRTDATPVQIAILTFAGQGGQLLGVMYVLARLKFNGRHLSTFGLGTVTPGGQLKRAVLGLIVALALVTPMSMIIPIIAEWFGHELPATAHELLEVMIGTDDMAVRVALTISAVALAPAIEEFIFRGLVQTTLLRIGLYEQRWLVIVPAALLFTTIHSAVGWHAWPMLFVLGLVLGWLYERSGSLWPGIFVHAGFNALNIVQALLLTGGDHGTAS